jgi:gliding motility-associated protein GldC
MIALPPYSPLRFFSTFAAKLIRIMQSTITIDVTLDEKKLPEKINWNASSSTAEAPRLAKAMMLAFWDGADKSALRMDLWTKEMMVDEMADFFYQTFMTMADTLDRATHQHELVDDIKKFAAEFYKKFRQSEQQQHNH